MRTDVICPNSSRSTFLVGRIHPNLEAGLVPTSIFFFCSSSPSPDCPSCQRQRQRRRRYRATCRAGDVFVGPCLHYLVPVHLLLAARHRRHIVSYCILGMGCQLLGGFLAAAARPVCACLWPVPTSSCRSPRPRPTTTHQAGKLAGNLLLRCRGVGNQRAGSAAEGRGLELDDSTESSWSSLGAADSSLARESPRASS